MTSTEFQPIDADELPSAATSEAQIAADAPAALRYLRRRGQVDLAEMLGVAS